MTVVVPYANDVSDPCTHRIVREHFDRLHIAADWRRMREPNSYALLFNELWHREKPFIIVEHDVLPQRGCLEELWACPGVFCGYEGMLWAVKVQPSGDCPIPRDTVWINVDGFLHRTLYERGIGFHEHSGIGPGVIHLH